MNRHAWLTHASFTELTARERITALIAEEFQEMLGPFERVGSPWLPLQGQMAQSDDGVVVGLGRFADRHMIVVAVEAAFEGGSIGEVGGAKIAVMLELAAESCRQGAPMAALLMLESGGVRLGEANLGLAAIARIQRAIVELRLLAPVVALIAGPTGCFGGMSLAAALCSQIVGTVHGRLGMNGPEVIEQEAGADEIDSTDRQQIWKLIGCEARLRNGFIDYLAEDTADAISLELHKAFAQPLRLPPRIDKAQERLVALREEISGPATLGDAALINVVTKHATQNGNSVKHPGAGRASQWLEALSDGCVMPVFDAPSVLSADISFGGERGLALGISPDPNSHLPRARHGEMGLEQGWALAAYLRAWLERQRLAGLRSPVLAIVDTPGQAYGRVEEQLCISAACAAAADAYIAARHAGHPVLTLVVGRAISGSFLAHGLQSDRILAIDASDVMMHAMSEQSIARITRRTVEQVREASANVAPMSYSIAAAHRLGIIHKLIEDVNAEHPGPADVAAVRAVLDLSLDAIRSGEVPSLAGNPLRQATLMVEQRLREEWVARTEVLAQAF